MKQFSLPLMMCGTSLALLLAVLLLLPACERQPQLARIEEITFQSGEFKLVGDLRTPAGIGPFPVVLFVHGSGDADRTLFGYYLPIMERMLRAGYAVFSWDKPGYGESTGQLREPHLRHQRAQIVLDAIKVVKARSDINPQRIGLWGISQASYVMPLVLTHSKDIAFMICVSCGGMSGHDLGVYQITTFAMFCADVLDEDADQRTALLAELEEARKFDAYEEYLHYREVLDALVDISPYRDKLLDFLSKNGGGGVVPEEAWLDNDPEIERWWNPVEVLEQLRMPVLAIFGDKDSNTDPGGIRLEKGLGAGGQPGLPSRTPTRC